MDEDIKRILTILMNPTNQEILALLSKGMYSTREIALILGRDESDISRRLSKMRKAGLVSYQWVRAGKRNIKLYKLEVEEITIRFTGNGTIFSLKNRGEVRSARPRIVPEIPSRSIFVGRSREFEELLHSEKPVVIVVGVPGIGKTSLVAEYYASTPMPAKIWVTLSDIDYLEFFAKRLVLLLESHSSSTLRDLQHFLSSRDYPGLAIAIAKIMDEFNALLVIDDYHECRDERLRAFIAKIAQTINEAKIVIVTRKLPVKLVSLLGQRAHVITLEGLLFSEAREFLHRIIGDEIPAPYMAEIYIATQGHPALLAFIGEIARKTSISRALELVTQGALAEKLWNYLSPYLDPAERQLVSIMACFEEPLERGLLESIAGIRGLEKRLYSLSDKRIVYEVNGDYALSEIVRRGARRPGISKQCRNTMIKAGDYYFGRAWERPERLDFFFKSVKYYAEASYAAGLIRAVKYRTLKLLYRVIDYLYIYESLLDNALSSLKDYTCRGYLLGETALVKLGQGNYQEAQRLLADAMTLLRNRGDKYSEAIARLLKTTLLLELGDTSRAGDEIGQLNRSLEEEAFSAEEENILKHLLYTRKSLYYVFSNRFRDAETSARKAVEVSKRLGSQVYAILASFNHALVAVLPYTEKIRVLETSYEAFDALSLNILKAYSALALAKIHERHDKRRAIRYAKEAARITHSARIKTLHCVTTSYLHAMLSDRGEEGVAHNPGDKQVCRMTGNTLSTAGIATLATWLLKRENEDIPLPPYAGVF